MEFLKTPLIWLQYMDKLMKFRWVWVMGNDPETNAVITDMMSENIDCINLLPSPHLLTLVAMETQAI